MRARRGFTLMEVMIALVIGAMAVTAAGGLLAGLSDRAVGIEAAAARADAKANAELVLVALVANLIFADDSVRMTGTADSAAFVTWCDTPGGWLAHCLATIRFDRSASPLAVMVNVQGAHSARVAWREGVSRGRLVYLDGSNGTLRWLEGWTGDAGPPAAIGLVRDGDTLMMPVGTR